MLIRFSILSPAVGAYQQGGNMTNEKLADLITAGANELIPTLWERVQRFLYLKAKDWYNYMPELCKRAGVEQEDLEQEAYFAFLDALNHWDPEAGYTFLTFTAYPLRNRFNALCGRRTDAQKKKPLNNSQSLQTPIGEEDLFLMDIIEDEAAEEDFRNVEKSIDQQRLHEVLEKCLNTLIPAQANAVRMRFYEDLTFEEIGKRLGCSRNMSRSRTGDGLRNLRRGKSGQLLKLWRADIISSTYHSSGFSLWDYTRTSSTEYAALKLIDLEESRKPIFPE